MNVLVTGSNGFIGRNLIAHLRERADSVVIAFDRQNCAADLRCALEKADVIYHLAGVNRPQRPDEFETGNACLTREICGILRKLERTPSIVMSSSIQAAQETPYGISKRQAEQALEEFAASTGACVRIYRLKNVFGKWCRPNYNSVVATFCHNIANDLPIEISDPNRELELVYVDDVITAFMADASLEIPSRKVALGELASRIRSFRDQRTSLLAPDCSDRFNRQLYATYLSYVPEKARRQQLQVRSDERGTLAEFMKSAGFGQVFLSRTPPGAVRGNHYHHTKTEKFLVVEGEGLVRMRHIQSSDISEYPVRGDAFQVIDIPPGYTHSIENTGCGDMVTLFWASEIFDPQCPDTYFDPVWNREAPAAVKA